MPIPLIACGRRSVHRKHYRLLAPRMESRRKIADQTLSIRSGKLVGYGRYNRPSYAGIGSPLGQLCGIGERLQIVSPADNAM